jgi:hypothetical protein
MGYFLNFAKLSKVNNHPFGENSPNLVTLSHLPKKSVSWFLTVTR